MKCLDKLFGRRSSQQQPATRPIHPGLRKERSAPQLSQLCQQRRTLDRTLHGSRSTDRLKRMARDRKSGAVRTPRSHHPTVATPATTQRSHRSLPPTPQTIVVSPPPQPIPVVRVRTAHHSLPPAPHSLPPAAVHLSAPAALLPREINIPWAGVADLHITARVFLSDCASILANAPHLRSATFERVRADDPAVAPYRQLVLSQRFHMEFAARAHALEALRLHDVRCDVSRLLGALDAPALAHLEVRFRRARPMDGEEVSELLRYVRSHDKMYRQRIGRYLRTVKVRGTGLENALYEFSAELLAKGGSDSERLRGRRDQYGRKVAAGFDIV
ncbi:hypothetical protein HDZ31DRAFT_62787 [Schizophyllum fasciatum]